jgi:hypothetical protein
MRLVRSVDHLSQECYDRRAVRIPRIPAWLLFFGVSASSANVWAFEGQTYLGAGLGIANYDRATSVGPAASLYAAYGLSDSFDGRLELISSWNEAEGQSSRSFLNSALAALTYKLDVIQIVPWGGLGLGVHQFGSKLAGPHRNSVEPGVSVLLGIDYALHREYGLSLAFGLHSMPFAEDGSPASLRYTTSLLRFERRFGW